MWAALARYEWGLFLIAALGLGVAELVAVNRAIRRSKPPDE